MAVLQRKAMSNWNHNYYIYLLTNCYNTVLYTGMTNDLIVRVQQHKSLKVIGFTSRYRITKLVHFEYFGHVNDAIKREKQIKSWSRARKNALVEKDNPGWDDLYPIIIGESSKK